MPASNALPLADVSAQMAELVTHRGWSLLTCHGIRGYSVYTAIQKQGVILTLYEEKGHRDVGVRLATPRYPELSPEIYRSPTILSALEAAGVQPDIHDIFSQTDQNLGAIKKYLSDPTTWDRAVQTGVAALIAKYEDWIRGPSGIREVAQSLAARHPWLATRNYPVPSEIRAVADRGAFIMSRQFRSAVVIAATGIGLIIVRYLS